MMIRSFIAIEISKSIQDAISRQIASLKQKYPNPGIRWVPSVNIHLTLKFLGEVSSQNLEILAKTIGDETKGLKPFSIPFLETGIFPNSRRPKVIWIGLSYQANLITLYKIIEAVSSSLGYQSEERPFTPHITLGRVGNDLSPITIQKMMEDLRSIDISSLEPVYIKSIKIFKSDIKLKGPVYSTIHTIPLNNIIS